MSAPSLKPMSVKDYLHSEEASAFRREYVGGFVYPLHGGTRAQNDTTQAGTTAGHVHIRRNITAALDAAAMKAGCDLFQSDMKLRVQATDNFYYPDVMAVCYPDVMAVCGPQLPAGDATFVTSPCLLIEVTSKSTAQDDRRAKHAANTAIPSVQTYLIVEQNVRRVTVYERACKRWTSADLADQGTVALPCLGTTLTLNQVYRGMLPLDS